MNTLSTTQRIFGREPAIWVGLVQAFVTMIIMFGLPITTEQGALIVALFNGAAGAYLAFKVRPIAVGSIVAFIQAAVALLVGFGLNLTTDQQGVLLTFAALLLNVMIVRPNVEPQVAKAEPLGADGISEPVTGPVIDGLNSNAEVALRAESTRDDDQLTESDLGRTETR